MKKIFLILGIITGVTAGVIMIYKTDSDSYQWLENVDGEKSLSWVKSMNAETLKVLEQLPEYPSIYKDSLEIFNSSEKIPSPQMAGDYIYNFWQDDKHIRGIWRRIAKESFLKGSHDWDILLDLDAMSESDGVKWVFKGAEGLYPEYSHFIVSLSKGGGDATVKKEFDTRPETRGFVSQGFELDETKSDASWIDQDTLIASAGFDESAQTTSGYPNQVKIWKRGSDFSKAPIIFEGERTDVGSWGYTIHSGEKLHTLVVRAKTFYTRQSFAWENDKLIPLKIPEDSEFEGILKNQAIIAIKSDWILGDQTLPQGALVSVDYGSLLNGEIENAQIIAAPDARSSIESYTLTQNYLVVNFLRNVKSELHRYQFDGQNWTATQLSAPELGSIWLGSTDSSHGDDLFYYFSNFLTPSTLYHVDLADSEAVNGKHLPVKTLPKYFDASPYQVKQYEARSKDGTLVPYFVVSSKDMVMDGSNPTLLYAYGGFENSSLPYYSGTLGRGWLSRGGTYVLANIRGGGEFGPSWHQAGLKEKRQNVYDDFHAVAEDLIAKKITSPKRLGIKGGSNGGLLVGVAITQRPDLYEAAICAVPLLDMKRFNKLLAGASWMGEYGNPDIPEEWEYISKYSPYHNVVADKTYPEVFFTTSTRDDRVHPGHARKMAAKMKDMGHKIYYFENIEGGHAGSSTNEQRARRDALEYSYLLMKLMK